MMQNSGRAKCVACPAHIPLTVLYGLIRRDVGELLGYEPGADLAAALPLSLTLADAPIKSSPTP